MDFVAAAEALEGSPLGAWARGSAVAYPAANLVHLLGLVMLLGGIGLMDLRLVGFFRSLPPAAMSRVLIPFAVAGLLLLVPSGLIMFAADAGPLVESRRFQLKLAVIAVALVNVLAFHRLWRMRFDDWDRHARWAARLMAAASLTLWLTAAALGRLIAYA